MPIWTWLVPALALALLPVGGVTGVGAALAALSGAGLVGAVIAAVHHAEVVAHRVGEPLGTLVLALAVTAIETALILSMWAGGSHAVLPRDDLRCVRSSAMACGPVQPLGAEAPRAKLSVEVPRRPRCAI